MIITAQTAWGFSRREDCVKLVLVTGCFDVIHIGHIKLLRHAATLGPVIVGVNCDDAVKILKGDKRPINTMRDRMVVIDEMQSVMWTAPIWRVRVDADIRGIRPSHWVKGGDYTLDTLDKGEVAAAREVGAEIVIFPSTGHSTTSILSKI